MSIIPALVIRAGNFRCEVHLIRYSLDMYIGNPMATLRIGWKPMRDL